VAPEIISVSRKSRSARRKMGRAAAAATLAIVPVVVAPKKEEKAEGHPVEQTYSTVSIDVAPRPNVTASFVASTYLKHKE
jgi:hypothetical protein